MLAINHVHILGGGLLYSDRSNGHISCCKQMRPELFNLPVRATELRVPNT